MPLSFSLIIARLSRVGTWGRRPPALPCRTQLHSWQKVRCSSALHASEDQIHHQPVLCSEVLAVFAEGPLRAFVDGTVGAGGHSAAVLQAHAELSYLIGLDVDPTALRLATARLNAISASLQRNVTIAVAQANFSTLEQTLRNQPRELSKVDGILFDIGVSSMQLDTPSRGFSFSQDGPLDMRMGPSAVHSAEELVNTLGEDELGRILREYGEERQWRRLARTICSTRDHNPIRSTHQLLAALRMPVKPRFNKGRKQLHPATRTFQALRIAVNNELAALRAALPQAVQCLAPGGKLAVISFHSLEDRIVKRAFLAAAGRGEVSEEAVADWQHMPIEEPEAVVKLLTRKPIQASAEEATANPRSRSAKLRAVQKL